MKYLPVKSIIEDYTLKTGNDEVTESELLKLTQSSLKKLLPADALSHFIVLLDVNNYKATLADNHKYVLQAAYQINKKIQLDKVYTQFKCKDYGTNCEYELNYKCKDCKETVIEIDVDDNYLRSHPEIFYNHSKFMSLYGNGPGTNITNYAEGFSLMRPTSNNFYNLTHIQNCLNFNVDSAIEYNINSGYIEVNFESGQILLAYLGYVIDDEGWLMIPDNENVIDAIIASIEERYAYITYRMSKNQVNRAFYNDVLMMKREAFKKAKLTLETPDSDEFNQIMINHWNRYLPNKQSEKYFNSYIGDKHIAKNYLIGDF